MVVSFASIDQIIAFERNPSPVKQFPMSALTYTLLLPNHPNIRMHSLLALLKRNPARESDDIVPLTLPVSISPQSNHRDCPYPTVLMSKAYTLKQPQT